MEKKAMIAMSGGVDSSVAALLVLKAGYETVGATMKLYDNDDIGRVEKSCCSIDDINDARSVAARLGMSYYVFNFKEDFRQQVIDRFVEAYCRGETPNPCIDCNRYMKFQRFMDRAKATGFEYVATGHYARVEKDEETGRWLLKKGIDEGKDQSYFLYSLTQEELSRLLLPLGGLSKEQVREIAEENGFVNARKHDSQDICFVPDGDYAAFIARYAHKHFPPGEFVGTQGQIYGEHKGIVYYTVGQRKGLGLSFPQPMYVRSIDPEHNRVELSTNEELFARGLIADHVNMISKERIEKPTHLKAKVRSRHHEQPATVQQLETGELKIVFDQPQRAITKGQAVVVYDGDTVVCGGTIRKVLTGEE